MVMLSAGDLALEIDFGSNNPRDVLQRSDYPADSWLDFVLDGQLVTNPFDYETLPSGKYKLRPESTPNILRFSRKVAILQRVDYGHWYDRGCSSANG